MVCFRSTCDRVTDNMPYHCSVPNCRGNYNGGPKVTVFKFPNDEKLKKKWLSSIGREDFVPSSCSRVCHIHFEEEDVVWETRSCDQKTGEVISFALKKPHLKRGAVPLLSPKCPASAPKQEVRYERREEEIVRPGCEQQVPLLQNISAQTGYTSLIFVGEILMPITGVILPCKVREAVQRTICLSDHNYARPYSSTPEKNSEDVANGNSKTSDEPSGTAERLSKTTPNSVTAVCTESAMVKSCAAINCTNRFKKGTNITFHKFPLSNKQLLAKWVTAIRRQGFEPTTNHYLCSEHFEEDCFLANYVVRRKLKDEAVPSLFKFTNHMQQKGAGGSESDGGSAPRVGESAASSLCLRLSNSQNQCAVYRCATNARKMPGIVCHSFPKDEHLRHEWLVRCRRSDEVNVKNARVCSVHFRPEDYERDLRNELLGLPLRKKLLPTAIPTLNMPSWDEGELLASGDVCQKTGICKRETVSLWTEDDMEKAIKACQEGTTQRRASELFGVPQSSLQRRLHRGADSAVQKHGRPRKKLRKDDNDDDDSESDRMDAVVQQILENPPDVVIKEEPIVKEEVEADPDTAGQQVFEFVSVKEEPEDEPYESTSPGTEESSEQMSQDQDLPSLIIKEEIDCDDYVDPAHISEEGYWQ